jgi:hypothetical protein
MYIAEGVNAKILEGSLNQIISMGGITFNALQSFEGIAGRAIESVGNAE